MRRITAFLIVSALLIAGCQPQPPAGGGDGSARTNTTSTVAIANTDPCAMRLHDVSGALLLYYLMNKRFPARLGELRTAPGMDSELQLDCPASKLPYVYVPGGIPAPKGQAGWIIVHDPVAAHSGMRLAITVQEPEGNNQAPLAKVVAVPESFFTGTRE